MYMGNKQKLETQPRENWRCKVPGWSFIRAGGKTTEVFVMEGQMDRAQRLITTKLGDKSDSCGYYQVFHLLSLMTQNDYLSYRPTYCWTLNKDPQQTCFQSALLMVWASNCETRTPCNIRANSKVYNETLIITGNPWEVRVPSERSRMV